MSLRPPVITDADGLHSLRENYPSANMVDLYAGQCQELARIKNPGGGFEENLSPPPVYIYYPWQNVILKCVDPTLLSALRTNRNKNLITAEEQQKLAECIVGVAGMSVGSGIALGLVYSGISDRIKIADRDNLDSSNLNRVRESLLSVGQPKAELAAKHIYEVNPLAKVDVFADGITDDNINIFLNEPRLNCAIDEIDDFKMKVQLRMKAREYGIPVIMLTSLGDNILIDIERYDLEPERPIFHGLINEISDEILTKSETTPEDIRKFSVTLVGQEYIPTRALQSVSQMGKTLVGRPQLYSTIAVDGGLASYIVRSLILDGKPDSGRYFVRFNELFEFENHELDITEERTQILERLRADD